MGNVYDLDKLMVQTRRLAAEYYQATQQVLPVSSEIAKYDAERLLNLTKPQKEMSGVDAISKHGVKIQVKSRVIFKESYSSYRMGQINPGGHWDRIVLVLMKPDYYPFEIYMADRETIDDASQSENPERSKRGAMSIAKFIAIGQLIWTESQGNLIEEF